MNRVMFVFAIALAMGLTIAADAGVPEPDVRLHGLVRLGGVAVEPGRDVTIEARVDGVTDPIGRHSFISLDCNSNGILDEEEDPADILAECSRYLLKLRMEAVVSGEPDVDNAARVGDTVDIFVIDAEDLSCDGAEAGTSCTDDTDCTGVSCLPRRRLMAKIEMLETGVIRELDLGFCNNGGFDLDLELITSRLFVNETASGSGDGASWGNAFTDLSDALNARICIGPLVSEVWVAGGEFFPTTLTNEADPRSVSFVIPSDLKMYGGFSGTETALEERILGVTVSTLTGDAGIPGFEGDNAYHVVTADGASAKTRLDGFTILQGRATGPGTAGRGAGLRSVNSQMTVANCMFANNIASLGGGAVFVTGGAPVFVDSTFSGNSITGGDGGAIHNESPDLTLTDCAFTDNSAPNPGGGSRGGALFNDLTGGQTCAGGTNVGQACWMDDDCPASTCFAVIVEGCTFAANAADLGGAIANVVSSPRIISSVFHGNSATTGGAIYNDAAADPAVGANTIVVNSEFVGNTALSGGGGMFNNIGCSTTITNTSMTANVSTTGVGGGIGGLLNEGNAVTLTNTILWANIAPAASTVLEEQLATNGIAVTVNYSCVQDLSSGSLGGAGNIEIDPLWVRNPDDGGDGWGDGNNDFGDLRLTVGSPCSDSGNNSADVDAFANIGVQAVPSTDLAGDPRFAENLCVSDTGLGDAPIIDMGSYEFATPVPQAVLRVKGDAIGTGDGQTWENAVPQLDLAMCVADNSGGVVQQIWVAAGTYVPALRTVANDPRSARLRLQDGLAVFGGFAGTESQVSQRNVTANETILSGDVEDNDTNQQATRADNLYHVVLASNANATAVLDGFTITAGNADGLGTLGIGGGVLVSAGSPTLRWCTIRDNEAENGAGMYALSGATPTLMNCTFAENVAGTEGSGLYNENSHSSILNCLFYENTGGASVFNDVGSTPALINTTLSENFRGISSTGGSLPTMVNCIVWGNGNNSAHQVIGAADATFCDIQGGLAGDGNIDANPTFVAPLQGNFRLVTGSPCINTGLNDAVDGVINFDLDGNIRIHNTVVDMGAYEFQGGDFGGDGIVDNQDLPALIECFSGPDALPTPAAPITTDQCLVIFDFDNDDDVDLGDFRTFIGLYQPPG